ncbi:helix-turn-helix domain-containing protein [Magnetospira thiophila]
MKTYCFTISCAPILESREADEIHDALFEEGCVDALIIERSGLFILEFDREAPSFARALFSALDAVVRAGMKPRRIGPDPFVSQSDIAERAHVTRQAISFYVTGKRGKGFPPPVLRQETTSPLWFWSDVAKWLAATEKAKVDFQTIQFAHWIDKANSSVVPAILKRFDQNI